TRTSATFPAKSISSSVFQVIGGSVLIQPQASSPLPASASTAPCARGSGTALERRINVPRGVGDRRLTVAAHCRLRRSGLSLRSRPAYLAMSERNHKEAAHGRDQGSREHHPDG